MNNLSPAQSLRERVEAAQMELTLALEDAARVDDPALARQVRAVWTANSQVAALAHRAAVQERRAAKERSHR